MTCTRRSRRFRCGEPAPPGPRPWRFHGSADPVHVRAHRRRVGADVHVRRRRARVAQAAVRPRQTGTPTAPVGDAGASTRHPRGGRWPVWPCCSRPGWRSRRSSGPQDSGNALPGVFYVLLWVGLPALSVAFGPVWQVMSPVRAVHRVHRTADPSAAPTRRPWLLARRSRPVRVRLARAGQPRPRVAWRHPHLAAGLSRGDPGRHAVVRNAVVRPRRSVRGLQRRRVTVVAAAPKPRRPHRDRQPVRPSAVPADSAGNRRGAVGPAGFHGVRQLLGDAAVARLRRRPRPTRS